MNNFNWIPALTLLLFVCWATSCSDDVRSKMAASKPALGTSNQMVVIADKDVWESEVGDTFRFYYKSAYPILPQPEPTFDIKHFTPRDLKAEPVRTELRTYVFLGNLTDETSETAMMIREDLGDKKIETAKTNKNYSTTIARDKWAQGQMLIYQFGFSHEELMNNVKKNFPAVAQKVRESDKRLIESSTYYGQENSNLMNEIKAKIGVDMRIPPDYYLAIHDGNSVWLRKETDVLSSNIILRKVKYTSEKQLTKEGIKIALDSLGRKYITTSIEGAYKHINDVDLPMMTKTMEINNFYAVESRGIWEMVNDFMGGPFVSYVFHNKEKGELLIAEGFVHAPGKDKRDFMQQLEHIFHTVKDF